MAFARYLPSPQQLQAVVAERADLKLSSFQEDEQTARKRCELDERLARVRGATRSLVRALDVDEANPLNGAWLKKLQAEQGLPQDDRILFTDGEIAAALVSFEAFHQLLVPNEAVDITTQAQRRPVTITQLQRSALGIAGWLQTSPSTRQERATKAATSVQTAARVRAAIKAKEALEAEAAETARAQLQAQEDEEGEEEDEEEDDE